MIKLTPKSKISESGVIFTTPKIRSSGLIVIGAWNWLNVKLGDNEISEKVIFQKQNDKKFLQLLNDIKGRSLGSGQIICQNIKKGFSDELDPIYTILSKYSILDKFLSSLDENSYKASTSVRSIS